ncbi:hypothetical protein OVY01_21660 [Robbsia sp. Bb-Pol-6]|uniref:Uncharacterized protein n=1 Tax=Robbsia betulipollinis TaxID=2981849 RepID=A0ABT3ZT94_9BURK|nr:hypothetical protein [Robbsia betulipollinis]MCY0389753.1 hypothetical protein [Robbsia betulipollinis]
MRDAHAVTGCAAALSALPLPRHSRAEARGRADVAASFAVRPVFAIRDRRYRLTLDGVGMPAGRGVPPDAGVPIGRLRLDDAIVDVTIPAALAWRWLNDLAAHAADVADRVSRDGTGEDLMAASAAETLSAPLARVLIDCMCRLFTRRAGRVLRGLPGSPPRLAWLGIAADAPRDAAASAPSVSGGTASGSTASGPMASGPTASPTYVALRVSACGVPAHAARRTRDANGPENSAAPHCSPDLDTPLGSIILTSPPGTPAAYALARLLAAVCADAGGHAGGTPITAAHARRIRFPCPIGVASLRLGLGVVRRLRRGDVLLPDEPTAAAPRATLLLPTGERLPPDVHPDVHPGADSGAWHAGTNECAMGAATVRIDVVTHCISLDADEIAQRLTYPTGYPPEYPLPPPAEPVPTVRLFLQGSEIGHGEWLHIGGRRGVRVLAWRAP